jgi:hypothetical protein
MKTWKKIGLGLLFIIVIFGVWFYPKYKMLRHTMHLFDENNIVTNFRSFDSIWPIPKQIQSSLSCLQTLNITILLMFQAVITLH